MRCKCSGRRVPEREVLTFPDGKNSICSAGLHPRTRLFCKMHGIYDPFVGLRLWQQDCCQSCNETRLEGEFMNASSSRLSQSLNSRFSTSKVVSLLALSGSL